MTIQEQIDERIKCAEPGTLFFINDFNEFDNAYVSKLLTITIGNKQIVLKRRAPRMYAYKSKLMPILELALKSKGQKNLLIGDMNHVRKLLIDSKEKDLIWNDLSIAPVWIRKMIKNLFNEMNYEFVAR